MTKLCLISVFALLASTLVVVVKAGQNTAKAWEDRRFLQEEDREELLSECSDVPYDAYVGFRNNHMDVFTRPTMGLGTQICKAVSFHLNDPSEKGLLPLQSEDFNGFKRTLYDLGVHNLSELIYAYDAVATTDVEYDVVSNNCAQLVLTMMCQLRIPVEESLLDWTVDQLLSTEENTIGILRMLQESSRLSELGVPEGQAPNATVVNDLVYNYVSKYAQCNTPFPTFAPTSPNAPQCPAGTYFLPGIGCLCFPGDSMVDVEDVGMVEMRSLKIGDSVKVDAGSYEPVFSFGHYLPQRMGNFKKIATLSGNTIVVSADHMIELPGGIFGPANMIKTGSSVMENGMETSVVSVKNVQSQGLYAPFTPSGKIVVDGISASCYVAFDKESTTMSIFGYYSVSFQWLAHSFEFPHRLFCHYLGKCANEEYTQDGVSTWVKAPLWISKFVLSWDSDLIKSALFATAVTVLSVFRLVEMVTFQFPTILLLLLLLIGLATFAANRRNKKKL